MTLDLKIQPSRWQLAMLTALHLIALLAIGSLAAATFTKILLWLLICGGWYWQAFLPFHVKNSLTIHYHEGLWSRANLPFTLISSYASAYLIILRIRDQSPQRNRSIVIWKDQLSIDAFRHLQVILRLSSTYMRKSHDKPNSSTAF